MKINTKSWHWEIYQLNLSKSENSRPNDICSYVRSVFGGLFSIIAIITLFSFIGLVFISDIGTFIGSLYYDEFFIFMPSIFVISNILIIVILGILIIDKSIKYIENCFIRSESDIFDNQPGFIASAWKAHKEKYCIKVDVVDE